MQSNPTLSLTDIDEMLKDCAVVTPVGAPNVEIDVSGDDDDEYRPMRVSSKGEVCLTRGGEGSPMNQRQHANWQLSFHCS